MRTFSVVCNNNTENWKLGKFIALVPRVPDPYFFTGAVVDCSDPNALLPDARRITVYCGCVYGNP